MQYMPVWPRPVASLISNYQLNRWISRESKRIAGEIYPSLWESVRRKMADSSAKELNAYAKVRTAQLSQERIDALMLAEPHLSGAFASRLLVSCTDRALRQLAVNLTNARRSAA
jgi:hypothetical protein